MSRLLSSYSRANLKGLLQGAEQKTLFRGLVATSQATNRSTARIMGPLAAKLVDLVYTYQDDIRRFIHRGKTNFVWVCFLSLTFLFSRSLMAFFCMRFLGIHDSTLGYVLELQMALIFLIYFAPTPGGSGLAEGVSLSIMAAVVPIGFAPYYNFLWRCSTLYLSAILGLFCIARTMARDVHTVILRRQMR